MDTARPEHLNVMFSPEYAVPIFGFTVPPLAALVLFINVLMIWTLRKRNMRSPVNSVLICIAVSDTLCVVLPVAPFVYFYSLGHYVDFVPFDWCRSYFNLVHVLPLLCNMASLWCTVMLASMRCYSVWRPLHVKAVITPFRTNAGIVVIYVVSLLVYSPMMFEYTYTPLTADSMMMPNSTMVSCHMQKTRTHAMDTFCTVHTWIQIIFTSLLPWFLITFPDFGMLWKLKSAEKDRDALNDGAALKGDKSSRSETDQMRNKHTSQRRMTTWLIFLVVSMSWLVEIPFAVQFTRYLSHSSGDVMHTFLGNGVVFVYLLKYITYPVIFVIYCFMSQRFRKEFIGIFRRSESRGYSRPSSKLTSSTARSRSESSGRHDSSA